MIKRAVLGMAIFVVLVLATGCLNNTKTVKTGPNTILEQKTEDKAKIIAELQDTLKEKDKIIEDLKEQLNNSGITAASFKEEMQEYKKNVSSMLTKLGEHELKKLAKNEWIYTISIDDNPIPQNGVINLSKSQFNLYLSERQTSYPILPPEIHNLGKISGKRIMEHLTISGYKPTNILDGLAGTFVESTAYEFKDVPKNIIINFELSKELQNRIGLETNIVKITVY